MKIVGVLAVPGMFSKVTDEVFGKYPGTIFLYDPTYEKEMDALYENRLTNNTVCIYDPFLCFSWNKKKREKLWREVTNDIEWLLIDPVNTNDPTIRGRFTEALLAQKTTAVVKYEGNTNS